MMEHLTSNIQSVNRGAPINNYKGVMLCNRPNENVFVPKERPFCSRVKPHDSLGLIVPKNPEGTQQTVKKMISPVLKRHKRWLEEFMLTNQLKKQSSLEQQVLDEEKFKKVREIGKRDRDVTKRMKDEFKQMNDLIVKEIGNNDAAQVKIKQLPLTESNLKRLDINDNDAQLKQKSNVKQKPKWALTTKQEEDKALAEEDELLSFVQNLDYDQYVNDLEVQNSNIYEVNVMLKALQQRVSELRQDTNWREKAENHLKQSDQSIHEKEPKIIKMDADMYDRISENLNKNDDMKSVASEKNQNNISKLREDQQKQKQGKQDWDKTVFLFDTQLKTVAKPFTISLEDRIAKYVADEVLRNYKHLGNVHSNSSIRKMLEKEARRTLNETQIEGPLINTIKNFDKSKGIDPNNLPYLHRNPAI